MGKIINYYRTIRSKNLRYIIFRSKYEFERRAGLLIKKYPTEVLPVVTPSLSDWRNNGCVWFFEDRVSIRIEKNRTVELKNKMDRILRGDVLFFSKTWKSLGPNYDWVTNPETGYRYETYQHWTKVNDFSQEAGDIKFVWEKSRFSWLLTVCRYDYHYDEDHAEFVISQILDWIDKNPLNCGPNYKCSQETSVRILNWLFALNFYRQSEALTDNRWNTIVTSIYWQTDHVLKNINFSRIAVRNNHAITETLTLYLMGLMFPMMKGADLWKKNGKRWFEKEIAYQIEDDGTFIQDSMNYHRVVIQLFTYAIAIADKHGERFSDFVYEKAYKSLNFLYQCQEPSNGWLPNYGANDGALFFPLSDNDYRDYKPQLDALHRLLTGVSLYDDYLEDAQWIGHNYSSAREPYDKIKKQFGIVKFEKSGYYLIREIDTFSFIRCGLFKNNGSTDQLHLDVWYKGEDVLIDGGSYMYNTDKKTIKYFEGTESHNTVMLGDCDQMLKGLRFTWLYPPRLIGVEVKEETDYYYFCGTINAFKEVGDNIILQRVIKKKKGVAELCIEDNIDGSPTDIRKRQIWHTNSSKVSILSNNERIEKKGFCSDYYGEKHFVNQIEFVTNEKEIKTIITIR